MLKWTVKKRFTDQQNVDDGIGESIKSIGGRRSLGDVLANKISAKSPKYHRRRSLGSHLNSERIKIDKENHLVTPVRRKSIRQNSTPLSDRSNVLKENGAKRKHHLISSAVVNSPTMSPISLNLKEIYVDPSTVIFPSSYAPTLPTFDVEYSPVMKLAKTSFDELPTKRLKMDFLDVSYEFKPETASTSSPLSTPLVTRKFGNEPKLALELSSTSESSLNSSEVGDTTLQKMIDDILASARHGKKFKQAFPRPSVSNQRDRNANTMKKRMSEVREDMEQKSIEKLLSPSKIAQAAERTIIIDDAADKDEREVKSPVKEDVLDLKNEETCQLKRQNAVRRKNNSNENKNKKKPEDSSHKDSHDLTIQKCLSFSSANFDISDKFKRSSVASNASSSSGSYISQGKYTKNLLMKGSLELAIKTEENRKKIVIHVIKCKNLIKSNEKPQINAYVKCALVTPDCQQNVYQRTAVHKNSFEPNFDHKFSFDLNEDEDQLKCIQLAVWHRNRDLKRSEFIGCLSILIQNVLDRDIEGSFMLQPQYCLNKPLPLVPEVEEKLAKIEETFQQISEEKNDNIVLKYLELSSSRGNTNLNGRTPFTMTRTIVKQVDETFGFEISWSKPPKINSVKENSIQSGLLKGDYIIFVGDTNIVAMPKESVVDLIKSQGHSLVLEIFRPTEKETCRQIIDSLASQSTPVAFKKASRLSIDPRRKANDQTGTPKTHKPCHFKQPKICFQPAVGSGVIV